MRAYTLKTLSIILVLCVFLSACGFKLIYNRLDWVAPFYVDDYVTLDDEQQIELHDKVSSLLSWHRSTQLNAYSSMLRKAKADVVNGLNQAVIDELFLEFDKGFSTILEAMAPHLVDMLLKASAEQQKELFSNLEKSNKKYRKKYIDISVEEKQEKIIEAMQDNFSDWLGDLSDKQKDILSQFANKLIPVDVDRYDYRLQWQAMFKQIYLSKKNREQLRAELIELFAHTKRFYPKSYKEKLDTNRGTLKQMLLTLDAEISKDQYEYLAEKLEYYAASFDDLSRQS